MNATTFLNSLRVITALGIVLAAGVTQAAVFTLVDGEGFEAPEYSQTMLEGQFASTFEDFGSVAWVQSPLGGTSTAVVQDSVVASGDQAVQVDRVANSDDRWAVPITGAPADRYVCIEWDMRVEESTTTGFGPFFGIEAYDDDATSILRIGSLGVDAATGEVLVTDRATGLIVTSETVNFGEWNSYRMILDFQTDTYYNFLNGVLIETEVGGMMVSSLDFESVGADQFTDADIAAIAASGDSASQSATGTAYFDNYLVFETDEFNKIPEPASVVGALMAIGLVGANRRRV